MFWSTFVRLEAPERSASPGPSGVGPGRHRARFREFVQRENVGSRRTVLEVSGFFLTVRSPLRPKNNPISEVCRLFSEVPGGFVVKV